LQVIIDFYLGFHSLIKIYYSGEYWEFSQRVFAFYLNSVFSNSVK